MGEPEEEEGEEVGGNKPKTVGPRVGPNLAGAHGPRVWVARGDGRDRLHRTYGPASRTLRKYKFIVVFKIQIYCYNFHEKKLNMQTNCCRTLTQLDLFKSKYTIENNCTVFR
jgi:hypothetical protein